MNTYSVSRLALALAFGVTLSACSSTPADQQPSTQTAPGTASRPVLTADEAKNFTGELFPVSRSERCCVDAVRHQPSGAAGFCRWACGYPGVTHTTIQAAVDAAITRHSNRRQFIAIMPGEYAGTVYVPAALAR